MDSSDKDNSILLEVGNNEVEFLLFQLGTQRYGINVSKVCQILLLNQQEIAQIPKQSDSVLGVMKFREKTISIVDLRNFLDIKRDEVRSPNDLLLVAEFNGRTTAFVVDSVDRIERFNWSRFEPIGDTSCNGSDGAVVGTVSLKDGIVVILDVETIMGVIDPSMRVDFYDKSIRSSTLDRSKIAILYCEDSAVVQKVFLKTLKEAGFDNIKSFTTGEDGLNYVKECDVKDIDIIVSDIEMPRMDGLTFCKQVRQLRAFEQVPFLFFSSMVNEQMKAKCRSVGGDDCFSKPEIHFLVEALERILIERSKKQ